MTTKLKLPWRKLGDEMPDPKRMVLVISATPKRRSETWSMSKLDGRRWEFGDIDGDRIRKEDRWIYLDELQSPFEEE